MDYNPDDQRVTSRQVLAGWILCFAMVGLAFTSMGHHQAIPAANADDPLQAVAAAWCPPSGVRLPYFVACTADPREVVRAASAVSLPANPCS